MIKKLVSVVVMLVFFAALFPTSALLVEGAKSAPAGLTVSPLSPEFVEYELKPPETNYGSRRI